LIAAALLVLGRFVLPYVRVDLTLYGLLVMVVCVLAIFLWWLFLSRARWIERIGALVLIALALFATSRLAHISIRTGSMGYLFPILSVPILAVVLVAWAFLTRKLSAGRRYLSLAVMVLVACGAFTLIRTGGFTGDFDHDFHFRWSKTPEERLLAQSNEEPAGTNSSSIQSGADWPGFRGKGRDGVVRGTHIKSDWSASAPVELWRRSVGPGWSSFAVHGDLIYTQEQRGNDEIVACYNLTNGKPVWQHRDAARFWESNAGAGPRGTPTITNGRLYSLGATGIVNALDATNGSVVWSRNAASDTKTKTPIWGFSGSPLVVDNNVIVATGGKLIAYDITTGEPRWYGPEGGSGYSSPHLFTIAGVPQVVLLGEHGATGVSPADGKVLWEHKWEGYPIVQPAIAANGDLLIVVSESSGTRSVSVTNNSGSWSATERWTSEGLNPYYNDFVVHNGHAFGFDWSTLACIDLKDGSQKWRGGRLGHGQIVLLPDQDLLLILTESGDLALVKASADQFTEVARVPAIKGKTWNHPALVGDVVLVRNGEEMAAFRLPQEVSAVSR
jgi:outer membrane protein assembly factor BamB